MCDRWRCVDPRTRWDRAERGTNPSDTCSDCGKAHNAAPIHLTHAATGESTGCGTRSSDRCSVCPRLWHQIRMNTYLDIGALGVDELREHLAQLVGVAQVPAGSDSLALARGHAGCRRRHAAGLGRRTAVPSHHCCTLPAGIGFGYNQRQSSYLLNT